VDIADELMEINMLENERQRETARIYGDLAQVS
jgi:hypothetical protein